MSHEYEGLLKDVDPERITKLMIAVSETAANDYVRARTDVMRMAADCRTTFDVIALRTKAGSEMKKIDGFFRGRLFSLAFPGINPDSLIRNLNKTAFRGR